MIERVIEETGEAWDAPKIRRSYSFLAVFIIIQVFNMTTKRSLKIVGFSVMLIFFPWLKGIAANHNFLLAYELEPEKSVEDDAGHEVTLKCAGIDQLHFFNCSAFRTAQNKEASGALSKQARILRHCIGLSIRDEVSFISMPGSVKNIGLAYGKEGQSIDNVGFTFEGFKSESKIKLMLIESVGGFLDGSRPLKKVPALSEKESASNLEFLFFFEVTGLLADYFSGMSEGDDGSITGLFSVLVHCFLDSIAEFGWGYTIVKESGKDNGGNGVQRFFKLIVPIGCKDGQKTCCKHLSFMDDLLKFIPERSMVRIAENKNKKERGGKKEKEKEENNGDILLSSLFETAVKKVPVRDNGDNFNNKVFADGGQRRKSNLHEGNAGRDQCADNDRCLLFFMDGYSEQNEFFTWILPKNPAQLKSLIQKRGHNLQQHKYQYMADKKALLVINAISKEGGKKIDSGMLYGMVDDMVEVVGFPYENNMNDSSGFCFNNDEGENYIVTSFEDCVEKVKEQGELIFDSLIHEGGFKRLSIASDHYCFYHSIAEWISVYAPPEKRESFFNSETDNKDGIDGVWLFKFWKKEVVKKIDMINEQITDEEEKKVSALGKEQCFEGLKQELKAKKGKLQSVKDTLWAKTGQGVWGDDDMIRQLVIPDMAPLVLVFTLEKQGGFQDSGQCTVPVLSAELFKDHNGSEIFDRESNDFMNTMGAVCREGGIILFHNVNHWSLVVPDNK